MQLRARMFLTAAVEICRLVRLAIVCTKEHYIDA